MAHRLYLLLWRTTQVENDIQQYSQSQQKQFSNLTAMTGSLQAEVGNNSNSISGLKTTLLIAQGKISKVETETTVLHDALAQLRKSVLPRLNQIESKYNLTYALVRSNLNSPKLIFGRKLDHLNTSPITLRDWITSLTFVTVKFVQNS